MFCALVFISILTRENFYYLLLRRAISDSSVSQYIFYCYKERESAFIQLRNARSNKAESRWNGQGGGGGEGRRRGDRANGRLQVPTVCIHQQNNRFQVYGGCARGLVHDRQGRSPSISHSIRWTRLPHPRVYLLSSCTMRNDSRAHQFYVSYAVCKFWNSVDEISCLVHAFIQLHCHFALTLLTNAIFLQKSIVLKDEKKE